jgi:hypothetical protein
MLLGLIAVCPRAPRTFGGTEAYGESAEAVDLWLNERSTFTSLMIGF